MISKIVPWIQTIVPAAILLFVALGPHGNAPAPGPTPDPQPSAISIPATVTTSPGVPAFVTAQTSCKSLQWITPDAGLTLIADAKLANTLEAIAISAVPGQYRIMALGVDGKAPVHSDWCVITVSGAQPPPGPSPQPGPQPPAPPVAKTVKIVVIDDVLKRAPAVASLVTDVAFWKSLTDAGAISHYANWNTSYPLGDYAKYAKSPPAFLIIDTSNGDVLNESELTLPADKAGVKALIEKYTGRKLAYAPDVATQECIAELKPIPDTLPEPHLPVAEKSAEPVEIYWYSTTNCTYCRKLEEDSKDSKDFRFRLAKPDDWSKQQEAAGNGYPMVRWQIGGNWTGTQFGWAGLKEFKRIWKSSQPKRKDA